MEKQNTNHSAKGIIGWREWIAFPELNVAKIKAKIDTGARSSAIHASRITPSRQNGVLWVNFEVHPTRKNKHLRISCSARVSDYRRVRSSNGQHEKRYVIVTDLEIMEEFYPIELTLTNREQMGFQVLLGRTAIRNRFLVDPGRSFLCGKRRTS